MVLAVSRIEGNDFHPFPNICLLGRTALTAKRNLFSFQKLGISFVVGPFRFSGKGLFVWIRLQDLGRPEVLLSASNDSLSPSVISTNTKARLHPPVVVCQLDLGTAEELAHKPSFAVFQRDEVSLLEEAILAARGSVNSVLRSHVVSPVPKPSVIGGLVFSVILYFILLPAVLPPPQRDGAQLWHFVLDVVIRQVVTRHPGPSAGSCAGVGVARAARALLY
mmetsp:Transcript_26593/g.64313  ORF Transcript_26593/g.64313 Transcript_26593/m.64313 type:complete len:221 (-) Transcript_26593:34-696(-)